jgi:sugar-phosphatase
MENGEDEAVGALECDAILFDMDGVLVDSTTGVVRIWREWAEKHGLDVDRVLEVSHGRRVAETIDLVAPELDAASEAREYQRIEVEGLDGVLEIEGAREILASLPPDGWTVVTSGTRFIAQKKLEHVGLPVPNRIVTAEDVEKGKPDPEAYLKGAEALGVRPEACVVVEDAPSGIRSAKAAGMRVIAVATTHRREDLTEADAVAASLAGIRVTPRSKPGAANRSRFEVRAQD